MACDTKRLRLNRLMLDPLHGALPQGLQVEGGSFYCRRLVPMACKLRCGSTWPVTGRQENVGM